MKSLKKAGIVTLGLIMALSVSACGKTEEKNQEVKEVVRVGVVGEANEMWNPVMDELAKEGILVELISFSDYATPNAALNGGEVDLNAFQHYAYLNSEIENNGYQITSIGDTYISAMNIYSDRYEDISQVKEGDKIAIPNDATNGGRALKVLEGAGLLEIKPEAGDNPEVSDITSNPLNLELVEVDAANVYSLLPDVAAGVINCNYALDSGLNPKEDAIFADSLEVYESDSYVNLIAARTEDADKEVYQKVVKAYQSEAVKAVYEDTFQGAYLPAWE